MTRTVEDLVSSAKAVRDRYASGRMDREIVRQWVVGLAVYPEPYKSLIETCAAWLKSSHTEMDPAEVRKVDLERLSAICD